MSASSIRHCETHGYFSGDTCPECDEPGEHVLNKSRRESLSKFMSGALRHFPDDVGLNPDGHGWVDAYALVDAARDRYDYATAEKLAAVVATDSKGRFDVDGNTIRASYGHSIDVTLENTEDSVPDTLYHGTPEQNLDSIMEDGLQPMGREHVHLAETVEDAVEVGRRHSNDIVVLAVDTECVESAGYEIEKRGNATYTTELVPVSCVNINQ